MPTRIDLLERVLEIRQDQYTRANEKYHASAGHSATAASPDALVELEEAEIAYIQAQLALAEATKERK